MLKKQGNAPDNGRNPQEATHSVLLQRVDEQLYHHVGEAVEPVQDLEEQWVPNEIVRLVIRYICKSAMKEESQRLGGECEKNLVPGAMPGDVLAYDKKVGSLSLN